ncbi:MAG: hypothetical protein OYH77_07860 [Pseudomonadota bacterium]|nr:hypothetical protein [Pseudomonadota bacterium]
MQWLNPDGALQVLLYGGRVFCPPLQAPYAGGLSSHAVQVVQAGVAGHVQS